MGLRYVQLLRHLELLGKLRGTDNHPSYDMVGTLDLWDDSAVLELGAQQWAAIEAARAQPSMTVEATDTAPPRLYVGSWEAATAADCWVHLDGWLKGTVVVNGHSLGRYWSIGPQHALYLPAPFLRVGRNEILVLELHPRAG